MKREIKFKGKRVKSDKWVYGNLLNECTIGKVGHGLESYYYTEVDPDTISQFTGIDGLYEGDKVRAVFHECYDTEINSFDEDDIVEGVIKFDSGCWYIIGDGEDEILYLYHVIDYADVEVIGSIHDVKEGGS